MAMTMSGYVLVVDLGTADNKPRVLRRFEHHRMKNHIVGNRVIKGLKAAKVVQEVEGPEADADDGKEESESDEASEDEDEQITVTVTRMAVSPDGQWLATSDDRSRTHVFNLDSIQVRLTSSFGLTDVDSFFPSTIVYFPPSPNQFTPSHSTPPHLQHSSLPSPITRSKYTTSSPDNSPLGLVTSSTPSHPVSPNSMIPSLVSHSTRNPQHQVARVKWHCSGEPLGFAKFNSMLQYGDMVGSTRRGGEMVRNITYRRHRPVRLVMKMGRSMERTSS